MYYLMAKHEQTGEVVVLHEEKVKHPAHFMRYFDYMYEGKNLSFSLINKKELNEFTEVIYVVSEEEFEAAIKKQTGGQHGEKKR